MDWIKEFHFKYLNCEMNQSEPVQQELFHVQYNEFDERIHPDIAGDMTKSLIDSSLILKTND